MAYNSTNNFASEARHLRSVAGNQRYAMKEAINDTLFAARQAAIRAMAVFDRPTQFTLHSPIVDKATKADLTGVLVIPTEARGAALAGGGALATLPAGKPLLAEVSGGGRRFKRSEVLLHRKGILPSGYYAVPGPAAQIDAYGNMTRGQINHLLAYFQAFGAKSYSGKRLQINTSDKGRAKLKRGIPRKHTGGFGREYFAVQPGTKGLKPGIYTRQLASRKGRGPLSRRVRAVLFFVTRAQYRKLYDFHTAAEQAVVGSFMERFNARLAEFAGGSSAVGG